MSEHGTRARYDAGCRCDDCKRANTTRNKALREELKNRPKDPNDPRHGTIGFYKNHFCRCERCSAVHAKRNKAAHERRLASGAKDNPADPRHGTHSFYLAWGCRCDRCVKAASRKATA